MEATFIGAGTEQINGNHRKEKGYAGGYIAVAVDESGCHEAVDLRLYWTETQCYCCVWVHKPGAYTGGSGKAGGYGYHKASAAANSAIRAAGWQLSESIGGVGDGAIEAAVRAIADAIYPKAQQIVIAHAHA